MSKYVNDTRSMNDQLHRGATDGTVRNVRPNAANAEYESATARARLLHPAHYGTFGDISDTPSFAVEQAMPDAAQREARRRAGIRGY